MDIYKKRRVKLIGTLVIGLFIVVAINSPTYTSIESVNEGVALGVSDNKLAVEVLKNLQIKGRAPKTGYERSQFGPGWSTNSGCDTRNIILNRDLSNVKIDDECNVTSGTLNDPYTGKIIEFKRGSGTSGKVQIDHVVALSDAWQKGAQLLTREAREQLANDPLELLAVDGPSNLEKSDGDAATWLPSNKSFRCQYVARQVAVKQKYKLWLTQAEYNAINNILDNCPNQILPTK